MTHTIEDLWNGNIAPVEHCGADDPLANELMERNREKLSGGLSERQKEIFQKYMDCSEEFLLRMQELAFCDGFSFGAKLIVGALL